MPKIKKKNKIEQCSKIFIYRDLNLQPAICDLQSAVCSLRSAVCNLQSVVCSLQMSYTAHRLLMQLLYIEVNSLFVSIVSPK